MCFSWFGAAKPHACFNRTFMELKYQLQVDIELELYVLIVPLWN